jgi:sarcosine oxidase
VGHDPAVREAYDVVVVGAGMAGLAATRALAQDGWDVLALEQFRLGHDRGSSHGSSRIFRLSHDDVGDVRRALHALELWRALEAESGDELIRANGQLDVWADVSGLEAALEECAVPFERLEPGEIRARFGIEAPSGSSGLLQADGGIALADRALAAFAESARRHGATIVEEARVDQLLPDEDTVAVESAAGRFTARAAVVTAGSWAPRLLAPLGIELPVEVTRETIAYFGLGEPRIVPSVIESETGGSFGAYALEAPGYGLKAGLHRSGPTVDPDEPGEPDERRVDWLAEWVAARFPFADPAPAGAQTCLYTSTDDERFLFERHGRVVVGSACSGRGFKFAPLTGRLVADLAGEVLDPSRAGTRASTRLS